MKDTKLFEIFYNSLSVGWHLRKIIEQQEDFLLNEKNWKRFESWLERHNCKPKYDKK